MKKGYKTNIEEVTIQNTDFRNVLYTGEKLQLVVMSLEPSQEIGLEIHEENDQFFRVEKGEAKAIVGETEYLLKDDDMLIVPAGVVHNVINTSTTEALKLYTLYALPHHKDKTIHPTKQIAEISEEEFDGITTE
jgi:mannose-6-phosphate isomerase-like protein (cupin superfamily)